jgi:hypothetical protein
LGFISIQVSRGSELFKLLYCSLDPAISHNVLDRKLTRVGFSPHSPTLITGDDSGAVSVFKIRNFENGWKKTAPEPNEQRSRLAQVMKRKQHDQTAEK